jgi:hypothetical protein
MFASGTQLVNECDSDIISEGTEIPEENVFQLRFLLKCATSWLTVEAYFLNKHTACVF